MSEDYSTTAEPASQAVYFHTSHRHEAEFLVKEHHYSHRVPSAVQLFATMHEAGGLWGDCGRCVAACIFSIPAARWSEHVLELTRFVRVPDCGLPLTRLISFACDVLRRRRREPLLVSYADSTVGHHGGIYQAASWNYAGSKSRMDGLVVDGQFVTGRNCNHMWGTQSPKKVADLCPTTTVEPHYDDGKHLYWRALNKAGRHAADRLGLESKPYPKPNETKGGND